MTSTTSVPTTTVLVAYANQDPVTLCQFQQLADRLTSHLDQPVIACPLDAPGNPVLDSIRQGLQQGAVKFVVLPLFLSPAEYQESAVAEAIEWASRRWSFLSFHVSHPPGWRQWIHILASYLPRMATNIDSTGVVLISPQGALDKVPFEVTGDLAKVARLLQDAEQLPRVELATSQSAAALGASIRHCIQEDVNRTLLIPAFLFESSAHAQLEATINELKDQITCPIELAAPLSQTDSLVEALSSLREEALADDSLLPVSWEEVRRQVEASNADHRTAQVGANGIPADEAQFQDLTERINAILPPRYQQSVGDESSVSAAPMASADLQFDGDGNVAWDQMWGLDDPDSPFCELALAGGPPHRGDLLEPVTVEACAAAPGKYAAVLAELERGIMLVAGLTTIESATLGWIGLQCDSEEMAIWLLRAIIVENVMVRRESDVLYLPAGPEFRLAEEIKNVVTVVAKTAHYWREHSLAMTMRSGLKLNKQTVP